jgi:hypothetical protein
MKKYLVVLVLVLAAAAGFSQNYMLDVKPAFEDFAQQVANVLPFNASIGLGWSDAYVGQFPHFGVGVTVGATTIPWSSVQAVVAIFPSISLPSQLSYIEQAGFPVPAYTLDGRIGGFGIPFDIGLKVGYMSPDLMAKMGMPLSLDYILAGADFRFAILNGKGLAPALSIGAGYSYMNGRLAVPGLLSGNITITDFEVPGDPGSPYVLELSNPSLDFAWDTNVLELKAEVSKTLLIFTPHLGAGAMFSFGSHAGGGLASELLIDGLPATQQQVEDIMQAYIDAGQTPPDLSTTGFIVKTQAPVGWAGRLFGGLSFNLLVVRLDLSAMYSFPFVDFLSGSYGGTVNLRVQM